MFGRLRSHPLDSGVGEEEQPGGPPCAPPPPAGVRVAVAARPPRPPSEASTRPASERSYASRSSSSKSSSAGSRHSSLSRGSRKVKTVANGVGLYVDARAPPPLERPPLRIPPVPSLAPPRQPPPPPRELSPERAAYLSKTVVAGVASPPGSPQRSPRRATPRGFQPATPWHARLAGVPGASPGLRARLSSEAAPAPHPLPDLGELSARMQALDLGGAVRSAASLSRAGAAPGGRRKTNQDACFAFRRYLEPAQALAGVLDGHGPQGERVSAFARAHLPVALAAELARRRGAFGADAAPEAALRAVFRQAHALLAGAAAVDARYSGSTATLALLQGRRLTAAWVGDSRAVLVRRAGRRAWRGAALTEDHRPSAPGEAARIAAAGGRVARLRDSRGAEVGPARVWLADAWVPGLAMSRSLGDLVAHSAGVTAEPGAVALDLGADDDALVLATDGVWDFVGEDEAAAAVGAAPTAEAACRALVDAALAGWRELADGGVVDDISCVVLKLNAR